MSRAEDDMRLCPACGALPCDWVNAPSDWQPIESAPKDREVLLYCAETGESFVAFWGTDPEDGDQQWVFARSPSVSFIVRSPTHWRDVPPAPESLIADSPPVERA